MSDPSFEILELEPPLSSMVNECELTGRRVVFVRNGTAVAVLISNDEYMALRETTELSGHAGIEQLLAEADDEIRRGAILLPEELFVE